MQPTCGRVLMAWWELSARSWAAIRPTAACSCSSMVAATGSRRCTGIETEWPCGTTATNQKTPISTSLQELNCIVLSQESLTKLVQLASEYRVQNGVMQCQQNQEESLPPAPSYSGTSSSGSTLKAVGIDPVKSAAEDAQCTEQNRQQASIVSRPRGGRS